MVFMGGFMMILFLVPFHPWMKLIMQHPLYNTKKVESCDGSIPIPIPIPIPVQDVRPGILINTKAKVMEIVEKITEMVNKFFQYPRNENTGEGEGAATEPFEKFFLSFGYGPPDHSLESGLQVIIIYFGNRGFYRNDVSELQKLWVVNLFYSTGSMCKKNEFPK